MQKASLKHKPRESVRETGGGHARSVRDVDFVYETSDAETVYLCGDFNDWHPTSLRMIGNAEEGLWEKRLTLPPGRYEYKFFVDGKWIHDPWAQPTTPNPFGTLNSIVEVKP